MISILVKILIAVIDGLYPLNERRFFVLETVARIPYFSYVSVLNLYHSIGKHPSLELSKLHFKQTINETWHLLIMEDLKGDKYWYDRIGSRFVGVVYYWFTVLVYIISPSSAYYMMELIEDHAYDIYTEYLSKNKETLMTTKATVVSLKYYKMTSDQMGQTNSNKNIEEVNMYDIFSIIANDELLHRDNMNRLKVG